MNSFTSTGKDFINNLSPRVALNYVLSNTLNLNASVGTYSKLASYTILGFRNNTGVLIHDNIPYIKNTHYVLGIEYLPKTILVF